MNKSQLEYWVHRIVDSVKNKQSDEDSHVELKRVWPNEFAKAARQLAGHANAAQGEPILWIIGLDEHEGLVGAERNELSNWKSQIESRFNEVMPDLVCDLNVHIDGHTIVALLFETERAPYVVKNPDGGGFKEVPWREGTRVNSATHSQLIRMLVPIQQIPDVELMSCQIRINLVDPRVTDWSVQATLYITPHTDRLIIPFHRCNVDAEMGSVPYCQTLGDIRLSPPCLQTFGGGTMVDSLTARSSPHEAVLDGPSIIYLEAHAIGQPTEFTSVNACRLRVKLGLAGNDRHAIFCADLIKEQCQDPMIVAFRLRPH
jgi:hypothetical protein